MIKVIKKRKSKGKKTPYYKLVFNYMIGDARGNTTEECVVSVDHKYVERFVSLLNTLTPTKGHWGIILEYDRMQAHATEGQITKDDLEFLMPLMFEGYDESDDDEDEDKWDFTDCVRGETEYSFLVFEGITLTYFDEYGVKHNTKIVTDKEKT